MEREGRGNNTQEMTLKWREVGRGRGGGGSGKGRGKGRGGKGRRGEEGERVGEKDEELERERN